MASKSIKQLSPEAKSVGAFVIAYVLVFFSLAYRKYAYFGTDSGDLGFFDNMFWWTVKGRIFYCSELEYTNLGMHTAFQWVQLIPFYWLFPGVPTLIFMQSLALGAAAIPVYLIARHVLQDHRTALLMAAAFVLLPPIVSQNVNQVEEPAFLAVYLLFATYFFVAERFRLFLVFAFIACLGRENIALAIFMFGIYALIIRRPWKWVVAPMVLGAVYFWLAMNVIMPYFRRGHFWHVMKMFSYLGDTPSGIVINGLTHPMLVINHLLEYSNMVYMILLVQPMAWVLPFFSPASLMALPDLAINTVSDNGAMKVIPWHYNVVTGCFLFVGTIFAVRRLGQWFRQRYGGNPEIIMAGALLVLSVAHWQLWFNPQSYMKLPEHDILMQALDQVPPGKSVIAPIRLISHIGRREHFHNLGLFEKNPTGAAQFEYVILDANDRQYAPIITQDFFNSFYRNPNYKLIFAQQDVFVFQRLGGESDWKIPPQ
jgi:uncharacterized membrane protein